MRCGIFIETSGYVSFKLCMVRDLVLQSHRPYHRTETICLLVPSISCNAWITFTIKNNLLPTKVTLSSN